MAYDRPSFYLTFGGPLYPSASQHEQWQTGVRFTSQTGHLLDEYLGALQAISIADILEDCTQLIHGDLLAGLTWSPVVGIEWAKLVVLDVDGTYAGAPKLQEQTAALGSGGVTMLPPQCAAVVSTWSGNTFGRANRGRCYLPAPSSWLASALVTDPRPSVTQTNYLRDAFRTWLGQVAGEISTVGLPTFPAIMSSLGTGTTNPIIRVSAGRVIDTMRSRRSSLDEAYVWATYP